MARFVCNRYPSLTVDKRIKFSEGVFETTNDKQAAKIRELDWFGSRILEDKVAEKEEG